MKRFIFYLLFFIIMTFPYIFALQAAGDSEQFGGFLLNPIDGNTYLAKMAEGRAGAWTFTLPYSYETHPGVFLFGFYLFLGHLSRWIGLSLPITYHAARLLAAGMLLWALSRFLKKYLSHHNLPGGEPATENKTRLYWPCMILCAFGSGLGWLASPFGMMTSDFWVAEAYPFLSAFTSPHFTLGGALMLFLFTQFDQMGFVNRLGFWLAGVLLGIVMPFGAVIAGLVLAGLAVWEWVKNRVVRVFPAAAVLFGAGLVVLAQYWQVYAQPLMRAWNEQNVTTSPPVWDVLISFSPAILFALADIFHLIRRGGLADIEKIVLLWFVSSLVLILIPFSLQRRFLFGFYIPTAILAVIGINYLFPRKNRPVFAVVLVLSVLTNILLLPGGVLAVAGGNPRLVIHEEELSAFDWLNENSESGSVLLCSPGLGNFVPAYTQNRVLYGHPFETPHAEVMAALVDGFYSGEGGMDDELAVLSEYDVAWVIMGPREREIGRPAVLSELSLVYENGQVAIYAVK